MIIINKTRPSVRLCLVMVLSLLFCWQALSQNSYSVEELYVLNKEKLEKGASLKENVQSSLDSPVNLLTGAVDFDIPIHTIRIGDYSLPISLHYETSGFRLTDISSSIGLGWTINGLGCITKTIKDVPDNTFCGYSNNYGRIAHFFNLDTITNNEDKKKLAELTLYNGCDKEPDIYSFSFPGHSGSFLFDKDNYIYMIPQQDLVIKFQNNVFIITDELGNKYYFGEGNSRDNLEKYNNTPIWKTENEWTNGSSSAVSGRFAYNSGTHCLELDKNYTTSWHLSKIKLASLNAEIIIDYEQEYICAYIGSDETYMYGRCYEINNQPNDPPTFTLARWMALRMNRFKHIYEPRIISITWKQDNHELGSIDFVPSEEFRDDLQNALGHESAHAIERINIINSNSAICTSFKLYHHRYYGNVDYKSYRNRLFLIMLEVSDSDDSALYNYQFTYNYNYFDNYYKNSAKIDYWGYYKPRGNNYNIVQECHLMKPTIYYYEGGFDDSLYKSIYSVWERTGKQPTYTLQGNDMSPAIVNPNATVNYNASLFTLAAVNMPLGARIEFKYENNKFHFDSKDILGPGVRVKKVIYKDGNNNNYETTYEYLDNDGISSGRIASIPDFGYYNTTAFIEGYHQNHSNQDKRNILTARHISTVSDIAGSSQANVKYGKVTVKNSQTGKTEYYHKLANNAENNSIYIGDNTYIHRTPVKSVQYVQTIPYTNDSVTISQYMPSHEDSFPKFTEPITSWCSNYLERKVVYNKNNDIVANTYYKYSLKPSSKKVSYLQSRFYIRYDTPWAIIDPNGVPYNYPFVTELVMLWGTNSYRTGVRRLDSIVNIKYDGGIENRTVTAYKYYDDIGKNLFVKEKSVKNSDGIVEKTNYTYPFNYSTPLMDSLRRRNIIATPVEEYVSKDGKVIDGTFKNYKYFGSYIRPNKVYRLRAASPLTNFSPSISGNQDARYEEVMSLKYDNTSGNTIETTEEGNAVTTYVWGYHHSLLLAVVKNADNNTVTSNLSCTMDELQNKTDSDELITIFNDLRRTLSDALITSYTYDASQHPLSVTDPAGKTCKYEYDNASRLKIIRDQDNNIVKSYDYHYR